MSTSEPNLFDAPAGEEADQERTGFHPDERDGAEPARTRHTPIRHLCQRLEQARGESGEYRVHPRQNRLWVVRKGSRYVLSINRGQKELVFSDEALRQFLPLLHVSVPLLQRLASLPRIEDCRLLNLLLWAEGAREDAYYVFLTRGDTIVAAHSGEFAAVTNRDIARELRAIEDEGLIQVRRYDLDGDQLWVEVEYPDVDPYDLTPRTAPDSFKSDYWQPGAVLFNQETGGRAITVVPVLWRTWGSVPLPVLSSKDDVRKRRHVQSAGERLIDKVMSDVRLTAEAPFGEAVQRLLKLHDQQIPNRGVHSYLEGLSLPFPHRGARDAVVRRVIAGRPSLYRLVTAVLGEVRRSDDMARRLKLALAIGRFVWSRGGSRSVRRSGKRA